MKTLKLFNGRWWGGSNQHAYIAAYSRADAIRVIIECLGYEPRGIMSEIRNYWHEGAWGIAMDGITPTRGLWVTEDKFGAKPKRIPQKELSRG